jgi:peptidoglycan hydrolase-like protein with peptidoglycan-binding domain
MTRKRIVTLICVLAVVAITAAGAWFVGGQIVSPAEAAARTAPPTPSPILVPIEHRMLSSEIVTRGTARFGLPQPIAIAPSPLKANVPGLITTLPSPSAQFQEGDMVLTMSGRPVLVLQGQIPAYRDLAPGTSGKDVGQLEQALKRLGFDPGPADGMYDRETSAAVAEWYTAAGFEPFGPTPEQLVNVKTLEVALGDAVKLKLAAETAAATAGLAVEAARLKAQHVYRTATADVAVKISDRALIMLDPNALQTARVAAEANLELARAAVRAAELEGEVALQTANDAKKVADFDATLTAERAAQLEKELQAARQKLGVQVPLDEIVFIPELPVRVEQVTGVIGSPPSGPILSVTDNEIVIDSALPLDAAPLVKPGMKVAIDEPAVGLKADGVVETVAKTPGTHGVDGYHIYFSVRVGETSVPLQNFSLRLTMPIQSTKGSVTVVPMSALSLAADGSSRVQVQKDDVLKYVAVEPGLAADGYVEVTSKDGALKQGQLVVVGNGKVDAAERTP